MSRFSNRLISLRKEQKMTQSDLAKLLGKQRSTVSGYETDGKEPDFDTLCTLADHFEVSVDYLLGRDDERRHADVVFRNDNNPHLRIHDTVFGVKVSADIQAKLANHEVVFIPGMKVGGKTISTDLRYSDTGRPLFGNNARNYRSRLGEENPRPRQRVRRRLPSLPGAQPKGMKIG